MRATLVILALGVAHGLIQKKPSKKDTSCEAIKPSDDASFDGERPGNPKNIADKFVVSVCRKSADALEGEFRVKKLLNCQNFQQDKKEFKFAVTEGLEAEAKAKLGQDEFVFSLEGPEVLVLQPNPSAALSQCEYVLPYKLTVPGKYHLNLVWTRENFAAINERVISFPEGHLDLPLGTSAFLQIGSGSTADALEKARTTGPKCNYRDASSRAGRWVYKGTDMEKMFSKRHARCVDRSLPGDNGLDVPDCARWIEAQVDYKNYEWIPNSCQPRRFTKEEARKCLTKNTLLLRGDSHLRHLYAALGDYACDLGDVVKGDGAYHSTCAATAPKKNACSGLPKQTLCYQQDYFGIGQPQPRLASFNMTVVNFGQHQADGANHQTLHRFKQGVAQYSNQLAKQFPENQARFVWHETNSLPFRLDHYVKEYKDWRTYHRLQLFNDVTTSTFEKLKVPVIPSFASTKAFSLHASNPAHFPKEILMAQVQNILGLLCE